MDLFSYLLGKKAGGGGGGGSSVEIHDMRYFAYNGSRATEIPTLKQLFKNVEKWEYAFCDINSNYTSVTEIDLTGATTSETTTVTMNSMFNGAWSVTKIIMPNVINGHVTTIDNMFNYCGALTTVDLSGSDVSSVRYYSSMFSECNAITTIDLSSFDNSNYASNNINMNNMFNNCFALSHIDMRNFDFTKVSGYGNAFNGVPTDCEIIVKDTTQKQWFASHFSTLTNVKTVDEL